MKEILLKTTRLCPIYTFVHLYKVQSSTMASILYITNDSTYVDDYMDLLMSLIVGLVDFLMTLIAKPHCKFIAET